MNASDIPTRARRLESNQWIRNGMFIVGPDDHTPWQSRYVSACSWCWIGATHSEAAHTAKLAPKA